MVVGGDQTFVRRAWPCGSPSLTGRCDIVDTMSSMSDAGDPTGAGILERHRGARPVVGHRRTDDRHAAGRSRRPCHRIEPPGGDPFAELSGTRVWLRGQATRHARPSRRCRPRGVPRAGARRGRRDRELRPGVAAKLGIDHATLLAANPRLIHCSITGYGETGKHAHRPAYDALVAARTGQQFESRGVVGTTIGRLAHAEILPGCDAPDGYADRRAAIRTAVQRRAVDQPRDVLQRVASRSMPRCSPARSPVAASTCTRRCCRARSRQPSGTWQRVEHADRDGFNSWVFDPRAPKGFLQGLRRPLDAPLGGAAALHPRRRRDGRARTGPALSAPTGRAGARVAGAGRHDRPARVPRRDARRGREVSGRRLGSSRRAGRRSGPARPVAGGGAARSRVRARRQRRRSRRHAHGGARVRVREGARRRRSAAPRTPASTPPT